jgi:ABC-type proline/glycine betaine transport system permease subunit
VTLLARFFHHRAVSVGYSCLLGLFAILLGYQAIAIYAVKITCEFYHTSLNQILLSAYYITSMTVSAVTLLGVIGWVVLGRWKRAMLFVALLLAGFFIGFKVFGDAAFYCFGEALTDMIRSILTPVIQVIQGTQPTP